MITPVLATTIITMVMIRVVSFAATLVFHTSIVHMIKKRQDVAMRDAHPLIAAKNHAYLRTVVMGQVFNAQIVADVGI